MPGSLRMLPNRALLAPLAAQEGLVPELEILDPGTGKSQSAFHFVACGASLLAAYAEPNCFPGADRRTKRRGSSWVTRNFNSEGSRRAVIFLAQAMALLLAEVVKRAGHLEDAERQLSFQRLIQDVYPLDQDELQRLEESLAEYRTLDFHEIRSDIWATETGTGYHLALKKEESPDDDPDLVQVQENYAASYLRGTASVTAIRLVIGRSGLHRSMTSWSVRVALLMTR